MAALLRADSIRRAASAQLSLPGERARSEPRPFFRWLKTWLDYGSQGEAIVGLAQFFVIPVAFSFWVAALATGFPLSRGKALALGGAGVLLGAASLAFLYGYYRRFSRWRQQLPFEVSGWDELVEPGTLSYTRWRPCRIVVRPGAGGAAAEESIQAALEVFAHRANRLFYKPSAEHPLRRRWRAEGASAAGSANIRVAGRIRRLCLRELKLIAEELEGSIRSVEVMAEDPLFEVEEYSAD